ncbi:hypothetical protein NE865_13198 [Phthorimaea operculella]|nr:hypothetical protein NE865_13198 [Phthorimaea operculella]
MKCSGCKKPCEARTASVTCAIGTCGKSFCNSCVDTTNFSANQKKAWKCSDCKIKEPSSSQDGNKEVKALTTQIGRLVEEIASLKDKLQEATTSLSKCHERLNDMANTITAADSRIKVLEKRVSEVDTLKATVYHLQSELNLQAQQQLRNEIEISGITESQGENLQHFVALAARKVGVALEDSDVDWISRAGPKRKLKPDESSQEDPSNSGKLQPRPIVVRLVRRTKRDQLLKAAKARRNITTTDFNLPGAPTAIFLNERLTRENRMLFREARAKAKACGYDFCWTYQGTVYVRQRAGKQAIPIRSQDDIARITSTDRSHEI